MLLIISFHNFCFAQNQGINNWWVFGYGSYWGSPWGHTKFDFTTGTPVITYDSLEMEFARTGATIADNAGNLLFYTNGYYIADASNDTMQNGSGLSPTPCSGIMTHGVNVPQACLILPKPGSSNIYYLFHNTVDNSNCNKSDRLYTSEIDMSLNGGLGGVINKNNILLNDTLNAGKITACKHANGRDWWVIVQRVNSNTFYEFLLTPSGVSLPIIQNIGTVRTNWLGMAAFTPDGTKYATFHAEYTTSGGLDIFDFNRCTGILSNSSHISIPQTTSFSGGLSFSGNSKYLYTANIDRLFQFDVTNPNIASTQQTVAIWDTFYSPQPPFATLFEIPQLAPDGKIYISTGNGTFHVHVINNPDSAGTACNIVQHAIQLQYFYYNGIPNHPNYFLGCDTTSACPCLTGMPHLNPPRGGGLNASPNPSNGVFTLQFPAESTSGELEVYNVMGNLVMKEYVAAWSQFKQVDISQLPSGIYLCKIKWDNGVRGSVKVVKE